MTVPVGAAVAQVRSSSSRVPGNSTGTRSSSAPRISACRSLSRPVPDRAAAGSVRPGWGPPPAGDPGSAAGRDRPDESPRNTKARSANSSRRKLATAAMLGRRRRSAGEKHSVSGSRRCPARAAGTGSPRSRAGPFGQHAGHPGGGRGRSSGSAPRRRGRQVATTPRQGSRVARSTASGVVPARLGMHLGQHLLAASSGSCRRSQDSGGGVSAPVHQIEDRPGMLAPVHVVAAAAARPPSETLGQPAEQAAPTRAAAGSRNPSPATSTAWPVRTRSVSAEGIPMGFSSRRL